MILAILVFSILCFLMLVWIALILNDGFSFTNKNIDNVVLKCEVLVNKGDEVIAKYKKMMININDSK